MSGVNPIGLAPFKQEVRRRAKTAGGTYSVIQAFTILAPKVASALAHTAVLSIQGALAQFTATNTVAPSWGHIDRAGFRALAENSSYNSPANDASRDVATTISCRWSRCGKHTSTEAGDRYGLQKCKNSLILRE